MTSRERVSVSLVVLGLLLLAVAAWAYDGWRAVVLVVGVAAVLFGILLGFEDETVPLERDDGGPERLIDPTEQVDPRPLGAVAEPLP